VAVSLLAALPEAALAQLDAQIGPELDRLVDRLRQDAPYRDGRLRRSIRWVRTAPGEYAVRLYAYGVYVSEGHRVARWGESTKRHRRYKTGGYVLGTGWIEKAFARWEAGLASRLATP